MTFGGITSATRSWLFSRPASHLPAFIAVFFTVAFCAGAQQNGVPPLLFPSESSKTPQEYYANAHPYLNEPLEQVVKRIPELDGLKPATDQQPLAKILQRTAEQVDESLQTITDVTAEESITEEKLDGQGKVVSRQEVQARYVILQRGAATVARLEEYRTDGNGQRIFEPALNQGHFVTSNFALMRAYFSTSLQPKTQFRYLGEQSIGARQTHVVAFAQKAEEAHMPVTLEGDSGPRGHFRVAMLVQGVAWIDEENAQILRMRTDLLAARPEIGLDWLTTTVNSREFHLPGVATPLWLPCDVNVSAQFSYRDAQTGESRVETFRNEHRYSNYRPSTSSAPMAPEAAPLTLDRMRPDNDLVITAEKADQSYYAHAQPYLEDPLNQLVEQIPELKKMKPATNEAALQGILQRAGANVDSFFANVVDVIAHEKIIMRRSAERVFSAPLQAEDSYLILRKPLGNHHEVLEYRMDAAGRRLDNLGLAQGFLSTSGFALVSNYLASGWQHESTFRYLGDEKIAARDTYVVGFAQKPGSATLQVHMRVPKGGQYPVLIQGIAWIDKQNFQIVRMRTDLLAPHPELGLGRQTTEVTFSAVRLVDVATPLWLPKDVEVYMTFTEHDQDTGGIFEIRFRNEHHYSDYRHYGVSVKMVSPPPGPD